MVLAWVDWPPSGSPAGPHPAAAARVQPAAAWTKPRALRSLAFWSVALPFALGIAAQVGFIVHQLAILEPSLGSVHASIAVALTGVFAIGARVLLSFFIDRLHQRLATAILLVNQAVALFAITRTSDPVALYVACSAFGITVGNLITFPSLIIQREFPAASFALVSNLATAVMGLTYAMAPGILGILRDATDGYAVPLYVCIATELLAAAIVLARVKAR
jgi:predicted MFS family arabinose efflux permease